MFITHTLLTNVPFDVKYFTAIDLCTAFGHKVSKTKLQYCLPQVEYLGRLNLIWHKGLAQTHLEGISKAPLLQTVGQMMTLVGMTGFSSD